MPLQAIILMFIIQIIGYVLLDRYGLGKFKYLILGLILILNFFVLPSYFIPDNPNKEPRCGMPVLAITFGFWVFGGGLALIAHISYNFLKGYFKN